MLTLYWDDETEFKQGYTKKTGYTYWSDLKSYKVCTEKKDKIMKVQRMNYVDTKRFTLMELLIL